MKGKGSSADSAAVASVTSSDAESPARDLVAAASPAVSPAASRSASEEEEALPPSSLYDGEPQRGPACPSSSTPDPSRAIRRRRMHQLRPFTASSASSTGASTARPPSALERPSSSGSLLGGRPGSGWDSARLQRPRPATAGSTTSSTASLGSCIFELPAVLRMDAPSALTSGGIVCGNLAAALRARRHRAAASASAAAAAAATAAIAWGRDDDDDDDVDDDDVDDDASSEERNEASHAAADDADSSNNSTSGAAGDNEGGNTMSESATSSTSSDALEQEFFIPPRLDLLESSRRWRRVFKTYREKNRDKWEKETNEDDNADARGENDGDGNKVDTEEKKEEEKKKGEEEKSTPEETKESKKDMQPKQTKEKERYRPPPCCAMMHMLRNADRNWDCGESNGRKGPSPEPPERGSRSRGHEFMRF